MPNNNKPLPSLIDQADAANTPLFFEDFGEAGKDAQAELATIKEHTAANLFSTDQDRYSLIVELLARQMSQRTIARVCKVSPNTVRAVAIREGSKVDALKTIISTRLKQFAALAAERLLDEAHDMPLDKLAIALGIAVDKAQLLDGEPTSITRHQEGAQVNDYLDALESLPEAKGRVIDAEEMTGFAGETLEQKAPTPQAIEQAATGSTESEPGAPDTATGDGESTD